MAIQNYLQDQINSAFDDCQKIIIYDNGKQKEFAKDTKEYDKILQLWQIAVNSGYEMPAYGVSLDKETRKDLESGFYMEFIFDETKTHNEMPYDALLIKLMQNQGGYQLIRLHDGIYEGRCFYININEINNDLYDYINSIK